MWEQTRLGVRSPAPDVCENPANWKTVKNWAHFLKLPNTLPPPRLPHLKTNPEFLSASLNERINK